MFADKRGKKVVLLAHCILNQNAKIDRCAHYPGMLLEVVSALIAAGVGVIQMPCPELLYLGLDREAEHGAVTTVESEDSRVAGRMQDDAAQALCRRLANDLVQQVEDYQKHGFEVIGVVGINGSPTCGVEIGWSTTGETHDPGEFIQTLREELDKKGISLPMRGIKAYEPSHVTSTLAALLSADSHH